MLKITIDTQKEKRFEQACIQLGKMLDNAYFAYDVELAHEIINTMDYVNYYFMIHPDVITFEQTIERKE